MRRKRGKHGVFDPGAIERVGRERPQAPIHTDRRRRAADEEHIAALRLNDEATLNIVDAAFAREQTAIFEADLARSRPISFAEWNDRPLKERVMERLASVLGSQL